MNLVAAVRRANRPGPPEHSIPLRAASAGAVIVAMAGCWSQGELTPWLALVAMGATATGNVVSYRRRERPAAWVKLALAVVVVVAFLWFFATVTSTTTVGDLSQVLGPLATLFTWIQVTHAFDVPSRRDLGFSLAGSATLMAVAAAQAIDTRFGLFVLAWAAFGVVGLCTMWASMAGVTRLRPATWLGAAAAVTTVALALVAILPAPHASSTIVLPAALGDGVRLATPGALVGGAQDGSEPARAGSPSGATRVGGLLGFAGPLDTAIRGQLSDQVVLRVRADRPSFWLAETFDHWDGLRWTEVAPRGEPAWRAVSASGDVLRGPADIQTFYVGVPGPNLVLHAADALRVWSPSRRLFVSSDGTIRSGTTMGSGAIYTVESRDTSASPVQLRQVPVASTRAEGARLVDPSYLELPHPYPRVQALARAVTADDANLYDAVRSLEGWIARHTRYTTSIPPLRPGQDTVTEFLFGNRRGYCEQISTSLVVMLRSLGLPAREAVGYVPGSFNPVTDLYEVQARDAHAWVQVWFPGYGWQSFDPTAIVPLANPSPARALAHDAAAAIRHLPLAGALPVAALGGAALTWRRWRRSRRRPGWTAAVSADLLAAARRSGLAVGPAEPLVVTGARLDRHWSAAGRPPPGAQELAAAAERAAYGGAPTDPATRRALRAAARRLRSAARARRRAGQPRPRASASSKLPPAASSGRKDMRTRGRPTPSTPVRRPRRP